jgi:hypothetical protein
VIPVEYRVEDIFASDFDVACFFPVPEDIFRIVIFNLLSFPI